MKNNRRSPKDELQRLLRAIQEVNLHANALYQTQDEPDELDAGERKIIRQEIERAINTVLMGVFFDQEVPIKKFKDWMSYAMFRKLEISGAIQLTRRGGRLLIKPSVFFAMWNALPENKVRKSGPGRPRANLLP